MPNILSPNHQLRSVHRRLALLLLFMGSALAVDFQVYAPSLATRTLWIVNASTHGEMLQLSMAEKIPLDLPGTTISSHPTLPVLYVAGDAGADGTFGVMIQINEDGTHAGHSRLPLTHDACYLSLDRSNRFLLSASYGTGKVSVHPLDASGMVGSASTTVSEGRKCAHAIGVSPDNRFAYVPYVKEHNALLQYQFDAKLGQLTPLNPANVQPPADTGPRHLVFHPTLTTVYFTNEQHLGISVYDRAADGRLTLRQVCDVVPPTADKSGVSASDLLITPDGRFLFAGLRGHARAFDWIARYRVNDDGTVALLGLTAADKVPWSLALSPDARFLLVTAFEGATLSAYRITPDGDLTNAGRLAWDKHIMDLVCRTQVVKKAR